MRRSIDVDEERDSQFPSFRRLDVQHWKRASFYPGAFIWLVPRFLAVFAVLFGEGSIFRILYVGSGVSYEKPLSGTRRWIYDSVMKYSNSLLCLLCGYTASHVYEEEVDYSLYLGPNWKSNEFKGKRVSTRVSNHIGILDVLA